MSALSSTACAASSMTTVSNVYAYSDSCPALASVAHTTSASSRTCLRVSESPASVRCSDRRCRLSSDCSSSRSSRRRSDSSFSSRCRSRACAPVMPAASCWRAACTCASTRRCSACTSPIGRPVSVPRARASSVTSCTLGCTASSRPNRTRRGTIRSPSTSTPSLRRATSSSIAALLGAHSKILASGVRFALRAGRCRTR